VINRFPIAGSRLIAFRALPLLVLAGTNLFADAVTSTNASVSTLGGSLPDTGASVIRVFGAMILVVGIFLSGVWLFKNWQRLFVQKNGGPKLNVLEVRSLGQRQSLYVVGYEQQRMLLAASPSGIALLSHLPDSEGTEAAAPATKMSFAEAFQQVVARKQ
jgi:flagellar biogenesis protein FliO